MNRQKRNKIILCALDDLLFQDLSTIILSFDTLLKQRWEQNDDFELTLDDSVATLERKKLKIQPSTSDFVRLFYFCGKYTFENSFSHFKIIVDRCAFVSLPIQIGFCTKYGGGRKLIHDRYSWISFDWDDSTMNVRHRNKESSERILTEQDKFKFWNFDRMAILAIEFKIDILNGFADLSIEGMDFNYRFKDDSLADSFVCCRTLINQNTSVLSFYLASIDE